MVGGVGGGVRAAVGFRVEAWLLTFLFSCSLFGFVLPLTFLAIEFARGLGGGGHDGEQGPPRYTRRINYFTQSIVLTFIVVTSSLFTWKVGAVGVE